ncbi:hypothetical protein FJR11_00465 [Anabaena sp. UHCC 0187]|nr:hypothetical protein [Anabaena sp. UHCC 0187]
MAILNRRDFILALSRQEIDVFFVDFDDLQQEFIKYML